MDAFGLTCAADDLMSRCGSCNGVGYFVLDASVVRERGGLGVHPKVIASVDEYFECRTCGKLFWAGPSFYATRNKFLKLFNDDTEADLAMGRAEPLKTGTGTASAAGNGIVKNRHAEGKAPHVEDEDEGDEGDEDES